MVHAQASHMINIYQLGDNDDGDKNKIVANGNENSEHNNNIDNHNNNNENKDNCITHNDDEMNGGGVTGSAIKDHNLNEYMRKQIILNGNGCAHDAKDDIQNTLSKDVSSIN